MKEPTISGQLIEALARIRELEAALDWALRHGAYSDLSEMGFVYVSSDGHRKKLPPFPPLIPVLEAARQRIAAQDRGNEHG